MTRRFLGALVLLVGVMACSGMTSLQNPSVSPPIDAPDLGEQPPLPGLVKTFEYIPATAGVALTQGGPSIAGYAADHVAHPARLWQPRHYTDATLPLEGRPSFYHFDLDPEFAWSNGYTPFSVVGGELLIRARSTAGVSPAFGVGEIPIDPNTSAAYDWLSGIMSSQPSFAQRGGYFEIEAKVPNGYANWPAFWLTTTTGTPEVDVFEIFGGSPGRDVYTFSSNAIKLGYVNDSVAHAMTVDLGLTYHKWAVYWDDTTMKWYFDGVEIRAKNISALPEFQIPMFVLISNQVGSRIGGFVPPPNVSTADPSDMLVRSVRAWQRAGPVGLELSQLAYLDDLVLGGTVATFNPTVFGGDNSLTYSIVSDPDNMFTVAGNALKLAQVVAATADSVHPVTLRATDSAGRIYTRQFTITAITATPVQTNLVVSQNLQSGWSTVNATLLSTATFAETAANGQHQLYVSAPIVKPASFKNYRVFADIDNAAGRPWIQIQIFNTGYTAMAMAYFNLASIATGFNVGSGGFTLTNPFITPLPNGKIRIGFDFATDADPGLRFSFGNMQDAVTASYVGDPSKITGVGNIWIYEP